MPCNLSSKLIVIRIRLPNSGVRCVRDLQDRVTKQQLATQLVRSGAVIATYLIPTTASSFNSCQGVPVRHEARILVTVGCNVACHLDSCPVSSDLIKG